MYSQGTFILTELSLKQNKCTHWKRGAYWDKVLTRKERSLRKKKTNLRKVGITARRKKKKKKKRGGNY